MQRRKFIASLLWLTGGATLGWKPLRAGISKPRTVKGAVKANGKGLANVVVSDGYSVVLTDKKGNYSLPFNEAATAVFVATPAGYAFAHENNIVRQYHQLGNDHRKKELTFNLVPLDKDDREHYFIIWADPQVKNKSDVKKMMEQSVPDTAAHIQSLGTGALVHGITVGDIVWDSPELFADYEKAVEQLGAPFFQCLGNHDMDLNKGGDETSDDTFQQLYGPTYYSFNRGQVHYVVMDNVRYLGKDKEYDGYITNNQLAWLKKDLEFVPKDKLVIVCVHIPVVNVKNQDELYAILQGYKTHIMSGHTHYHRNTVTQGIYEHNHGTVCGAWWTGPICGDGTPPGYGVYTVSGTDISWYYKSVNKPVEHQCRLIVTPVENGRELMINVWNYDADWKVELWVNDQSRGVLQPVSDYDPVAVSLYKGSALPKSRGFVEPVLTDHLFKFTLPAEATTVKVVMTDPFGKQYTEVQAL